MSMECKQYKLRQNPVITAIQFDRTKIDDIIMRNDNTDDLLEAIIELRDKLVEFLGISIEDEDSWDSNKDFLEDSLDIWIYNPFKLNIPKKENMDFIDYKRIFNSGNITVGVSIGYKSPHNGDYIVKYNNYFYDIIPEEEFKAKYEEII